MVIKLYTAELSPAVRAVMMAFDIFEVPFEKIEVNLLANEEMSPEFLSKNPLHTIPVLEDEDCIINESHVMLMYLADAYGTDEAWYPKDKKKRTLVNQQLFFDSTYLFPRLRNLMAAIVMGRKGSINPKLKENIEEGYRYVEQFLSRTAYIAGDQITIADLSVYSNMSSLSSLVPVAENEFPKTSAWLALMAQEPYCQKYNEEGAETFEHLLKELQSVSTANTSTAGHAPKRREQ